MAYGRPNSPEGYRYIRAWGQVQKLGSEAIANLQQAAWAAGADSRACFRRFKRGPVRGGEVTLLSWWVLYDELSPEEQFAMDVVLTQEAGHDGYVSL